VSDFELLPEPPRKPFEFPRPAVEPPDYLWFAVKAGELAADMATHAHLHDAEKTAYSNARVAGHFGLLHLADTPEKRAEREHRFKEHLAKRDQEDRKAAKPLRGWEDVLGAYAWEPRLIEILRRHVAAVVLESGEEPTEDALTRAARVFRLRYEDRYGNLLKLKHWVLEQTGDVVR
jgi:hypothetical protein